MSATSTVIDLTGGPLGDIPTWVTAICTLALAALALFQDYFRSLVWSPKLELTIHPSPPDFHATEITLPLMVDPTDDPPTSSPCYYFRIRVTNSGNCEAKEVEIYVKDLKQVVNGRLKLVPRFSPMDLLWSDVRTPTLRILVPGLPKLCDLAHVVHPDYKSYLDHELDECEEDRTVLALDLQGAPNSKGHLIGPGTYRLTLAVAATNATPREFLVDVNVSGDWYDEPDRMYADGVRFHLR